MKAKRCQLKIVLINKAELGHLVKKTLKHGFLEFYNWR
jgi:hypothetical protein